VRSQENERWKHKWRQNIKASLSRRLNSNDNVAGTTSTGSFQWLPRILVSPIEEGPSRRRETSCAENIVDGSNFQAVAGCIIGLNVAYLGVMTDISTRNAAKSPAEVDPAWFTPLENVFVCLFLAEVLFRMYAKRIRYIVGSEWRWNLFDCATLLLTCIEQFIGLLSAEWDFAYTRVVRVFRIIRVLRVIRVLRFFRELRLMVCSISSSVVSLSWALLLLFLINYIFAICFMHAVEGYLQHDGHEELVRDGLLKWYGTLPKTMYSLLMAVTGGVDWWEMVVPLSHVHLVYEILFAFYVLFIVVGVLNVLTSVFVQRANDLVRLDRDLIIQNQLVSNETFQREMKAIFEEVDKDDSGTINWDEFWEYMQHEDVQAYFVTQQLDTSDARELFNLLDVDGKGEVSIEDFVMGCTKLRGQARSSDVATLLRESKKTGQKTMKVMRKMERQLGTLCHQFAPADASCRSLWNTSPASRLGWSPMSVKKIRSR